jgi:hypothetical protein
MENPRKYKYHSGIRNSSANKPIDRVGSGLIGGGSLFLLGQSTKPRSGLGEAGRKK